MDIVYSCNAGKPKAGRSRRSSRCFMPSRPIIIELLNNISPIIGKTPITERSILNEKTELQRPLYQTKAFKK